MPGTPAGTVVDVVIAGGGMVGASLAVALSRLPLRVALVEQVPVADTAQPSFDMRTVALSRSSRRILGTLGVWPVVQDSASAIRRIHVSEQGRFGTAVIDAAEEGVDALGHVVGSRQLGTALWSAVDAAGNVLIHCPATVADATAGETEVVVTLDDGPRTVLRSRLLVVADGARSRLRTALGIEARIRPYDQVAIVGNVAVAVPGGGDQAFERFTPAGPLALLPVGEDHFAFVLTRRTDEAPALMALDDGDFLEILQSEFGHRLGRFTRLGRRAAYPLELVRATQVVSGRVAVIGNAAHSLHPVAGQGYNLGLRDVAILAELIADDIHAGKSAPDPGARALLAAYQDWRRQDQRQVVAFTDGLIRFFGADAPALGVARGLGLLGFDVLPGAKAALARRTMGLGGRLGRLVRGLPL